MKHLFLYILLLITCNLTYGQVDTLAIREQILKLQDSSTVAFNHSRYKKSQNINQQILKLAGSINDSNLLHVGYRYLAYDFNVAGDTIKAKQALNAALSYTQASTDIIQIADTYLLEASIRDKSKQPFKKILSSYQKCIDIYNKKKDSLRLGVAYTNLVDMSLRHNQLDITEVYLKLNKKIIANHVPNEVYYYYTQLANYLVKKKDYEQAEFYINYAENHESNTGSILDKETICTIKADIYEGTGRYKEAYEAIIESKKALIKTQEEIHTKELKKVTASFELERYKKDAEINKKNIALQDELLESKSKINNFLILISAVSFFAIAYLFYSVNNRKKLIKKLTTKNEEYLEAKKESERLALAKTNFFNTVSHELRTPLYGVIGISSLLIDEAEIPKKSLENLKTLKFSADYLLALVDDVLQLSKIDADKIPLESSIIKIKDLLNAILSTFEFSKTQNNNHFKLHIDKNVPLVFTGNSMILKQVLMNLIGNAIKFTENGTIKIEVKLSHSQNQVDYLEFNVIDDGPGIPINKQKEIFAEFTQLQNNDTNYGTGLGLAIVAKLLHLINSRINLVSELGKGSKFSFKFPIEESHLTDEKQYLLSDLDDDSIFENKKILVVDDNTINQLVTSKILEKLKSKCDIANNGREAVEKIQKEEFQLVLMDINMPVLDGFEATREIRSLGYDLPIIALTAVEADEVEKQSIESGMNGYIIKPYDINVFKRTISINFK
ncbi:response regulator [uncultured Nonlabens sp.]|uniref:response regulator n=1 Tax=uncultured Nonlabens sp. TaxID=859306 RepID=UPI0026397636|nr:response regulator [uncultured Nonlabens sp.]